MRLKYFDDIRMAIPVTTRALIPALFITILLMSCGDGSETRGAQNALAADLPEGFVPFYERFHRDMVFQKEHIAFPLDGIPAGEDLPGDFAWTADNWIDHKRFDSSNDEFEQRFTVLSEDFVVETITKKGTNITMQRRFARLAEGWHLIYYVEMQPVVSVPDQ